MRGVVQPHLGPALLAVVMIVTAVIGGDLYARRLEARYVHALAPELFPQKMQGSVLQAEAFRQPDLLPLYGTSELDSFVGPYSASEFFRTYPTGFQVAPVGHQGTTPLIILQDLAAIGPEVRGKKLVISISATWFTHADPARQHYYQGNFSRLHAGELAFSTDLSFALKQAAARRMLAFPDTLESDPLLRRALELLVDGSSAGRALYDALLPLGKLRNLVLHLQDQWETLAFIRARPDLSPEVPRRAERPDWASLRVKAERLAQQRAGNNPFGYDSAFWKLHADELKGQKDTYKDRAFLAAVQGGAGWTDLQLLLRGLRELGAQPLLLSAPLKGVLFDYRGVSGQARQAYYEKLRELAERYDVPLLDFADHDEDRYFVVDHSSHPSQKGWLYFDEALDAFYRGTPRPSGGGDVPP